MITIETLASYLRKRFPDIHITTGCGVKTNIIYFNGEAMLVYPVASQVYNVDITDSIIDHYVEITEVALRKQLGGDTIVVDKKEIL